jgi:hypothetical protein
VVPLLPYMWPSPSQFTTDGPSVSMSWCRAPPGAHDQIVVNCLTVVVLSCSCALSDERSGLSFVSIYVALRVAVSYKLSASQAWSNRSWR